MIQKNSKNTETTTLIIGLSILLCVLVFLAMPLYSGLSIFGKGNFLFLESLFLTLASFFTYICLVFVVIKKWLGVRKDYNISLFFFSSVVVGACTLLATIAAVWMRFEVKTQCLNAQNMYKGDCVTALINLVNDKKQKYLFRNNAIWVLGQLADRRALPLLYMYYTGDVSKREPLHATLSQYELRKAIRWCEKGNITSWMY